MRLFFVSTAILLAALAAPAFAQQSSREDFKEYCRAVQGRWVGDVTWVADWPGLGKKGDKVTCYAEGRIVEDGNAMHIRSFAGNGSGTGLIVFDASAKQIKSVWVDSGGTIGQGVVFKKDGHWVEKSSGCTADGTKTEYTSTLTIADNGNTHTWTGSGTLGGKKIDDRHDVYRRVGK